MTSSSEVYRSPVVRLANVRCAYGGTGVSPAGYCAIMPYFDATAIHAVSGLRVTDLEVVEGETRVARTSSPINLRISLPGRDRDHNFIYAAFDGAIAPGTTLRLCASTDLTTLPPSCRLSSCRYRATIIVTSDAGDVEFMLEGPLDDPWPTAGPRVVG